MLDESQERQWVRQAQAGDRPAFESLSRELQGELEAALGSMLGRLAARGIDRDEILQETWIKAHGAIERFEWQGTGSTLRWLCGIARHVMLKAVRSQERRSERELKIDVPSRETSASRTARREERLERLEAALLKLSPEHRDVIRMARLEGLKSEEIAVRMGHSPEAVRQLLVRALKALRATFGDTDSLSLPRCGLDPRRLEEDGGGHAR